MTSSVPVFLGVLFPILGLVITLLLLYVVVHSAIISALRRARGEAWIEQNLPDKAKWLTVAQRTVLSEDKARRDRRSSTDGLAP